MLRAILVVVGLALLAAPAGSETGAVAVGVPVYDMPDNGLATCASPLGPCRVVERRTTIWGTEDRCLHP